MLPPHAAPRQHSRATAGAMPHPQKRPHPLTTTTMLATTTLPTHTTSTPTLYPAVLHMLKEQNQMLPPSRLAPAAQHRKRSHGGGQAAHLETAHSVDSTVATNHIVTAISTMTSHPPPDYSCRTVCVYPCTPFADTLTMFSLPCKGYRNRTRCCPLMLFPCSTTSKAQPQRRPGRMPGQSPVTAPLSATTSPHGKHHLGLAHST